MSVTVHPFDATLTDDEIARWADVPVSIVVDLDAGRQIDPAIRPLPGPRRRLIGPALTVRCSPPDFGSVVASLDHARPGSVVVIAAGGNTAWAVIGDILGGRLRDLGCAGLVVDGAVRDVENLGSFDDFPVYARAINPLGPTSGDDGEIDGPIEIGDRSIAPGDLIIGDADGLAVLPPEFVRTRRDDAAASLAREAAWIAGLAAGRPVSELFGS